MTDRDDSAAGPKILSQTFYLVQCDKCQADSSPSVPFIRQWRWRLGASSEDGLSSAEIPEKRSRQQTRTHAGTAEEALVTHRKLERLKQGSSRGDT